MNTTALLIGMIGSIMGSLVTIFLTPRLQHYFWGYQRLGEIRLSAINELNSLAAEFLNEYMKNPNPTFRPDDAFFRRLMVASANMKVLFSEEAYRAFKGFEVMFGPNLGLAKGAVDVFVDARDKALTALYKEAVRAKRV